MADSLKYLIDRLKRTKLISSQPIHVETLRSIDEFADNEFYKAYLLGHFFKYKLDSDRLPEDEKTFLIDTIKRKNLASYYYLKTKPESDGFGQLIYWFIILGLVAIIAGTVQLSNGYFSFGLGTRYLVPVIREGGAIIISGIVFFLGGLLRLRYENKKKHFLNSFLSSNNNSN